MIDVAIAIDGEAVAMTRTRAASGSYSDDGKWVAGGSASASIPAVIQPATGNQLTDVPEGVRTEAQWLLWSRSDIAIDDRITHKSIVYRALYVWPRDEGGFYRAALGRETP